MHGTASPQRLPKGVIAALAIAGTLAAGVAGGFAARFAHLPLPWLLGPLVAIMALSLAGVPIRLIPWGRPAGTIVVGASIGLQFTTAVLLKLVTLLPLMIGAAFVSTLIGLVGGLIYMRLTGVDRCTAFFATVPGGVVETTTLAPHYGAQLEPIMVAQTTRVALIVVFAPFLVISIVGAGGPNPLLAIPVAPWLPVLAMLAVSAAVGALLSRTRSPSAFLLPPLFIATLCSGLGWIEGRMPDLLLIAAQIVIGSSLGAQFRPEFLTRLFGMLRAACAVLLFSGGSMALMASGHRVGHRLLDPDDDPGDGARRAGRDGADRQAARSRRHRHHRLPADPHHRGADLVPDRAHPVRAARRLDVRQGAAGSQMTLARLTTKRFALC